MTDLLDRIRHKGMDKTLIPIPIHGFSGAATLAALNKITRQNIIDKWNLVGDEVTQLDAIIAVYQGKPNASQKQSYLDTLVACLLLYEDVTLTKTQVQTMLEI